MQNTLGDLNNHLFSQLKRLSNDGLEGDKLKEELLRSKAVADIAKNIIENAKTVLDGKKFETEILGRSQVTSPKMLEG